MRILLTANTSFALINFRAGLIRALNEAGHELLALVPCDEYTSDLEAAGCEIVPLPLDRRGTSLPREAGSLASAFVKVRRIRPDVILSYTIKNNLYVGVTAHQLGIPIVPNVTGLGTLFCGRNLLGEVAQQMYRVALRPAPVVFFQNSHDRERFIDLGIVCAARARLLPGSGVDLARFAVAPLPGRDEAPVFLMIARLLWDKGVGEFVEAARLIRKQVPGASFKLLGAVESPGPSAVPLEKVERWVAEGVIDYLGTVRDVRPVIEAADCMVLPSYYREGTPRVLLEGAAAGRPIVTTDAPGCRDVVQEGVSGFLVRPRDVPDLGRAMLAIAHATPAKRAAMGRAARANMEARYDERLVIAAYLEALDHIDRAR